ncbi:hypothetical protein [Moraxella ovis]|uniref:hypothetical protein n=1 Tax=Moraxella ovis TaxID=29433 RepID=UPI000DFBAE27|nr:hypothetical protein [Moraxella ovis]STZ31374.1 Uncharacterised protein [Moraxella ovis]
MNKPANKTTPRKIYQSLATGVDYYGLLAKDRLGQQLSLSEIGGNALPNISAQDSARVMRDPHFARAFVMMSNMSALSIQGVSGTGRSKKPAMPTITRWHWLLPSARMI